MKKLFLSGIAVALFFCAAATAFAQDAQPLKLVQTIPMPNVKGRIDHMDVDVKAKRLFVAGLENGSVEVVDLQAGRWTKSIRGFLQPQGIAYVAALNKLFVASGDDGMVRVFRGDTLELLDAIKLDLGPNRVAYDAGKQVLYVGYGGKNAGKDYGEVGAIDARTDKKIFDVQVAAHPSEILLDKSGETLFVFISVASKLQVIDLKKREVRATWPVSSQRPGDAALDEASGRLLIGARTPPELVAMDSKTGKEVPIYRPPREWTACISMRSERGFAFQAGAARMSARFLFISRKVLTATKSRGRFLLGRARELRSGRRN
jgi:hypothetical protein